MNIRVKRYHRYEKKTLQAFVDLELLDIGLVIKDCTVHQKDGKAWVGMPARKYTDSDGEIAWSDIVEFSTKEKKEEFRKYAVEAMKYYVTKEKEKPTDNYPEESNDTPF